MNSQALAILWAQWKSTYNFTARATKGGVIFTAIITALWYGAVLAASVAVAVVMAKGGSEPVLGKLLRVGLFLCFLYWQLFPVLMASSGIFLDVRRLQVYPIPSSQLFRLETMLRISVAVEVVFLTLGGAIGRLFHGAGGLQGSLALLVYLLFNLFLSVGMKQVLGRVLERKYAREVLLVSLLSLGMLPQALLVMGPPKALVAFFKTPPAIVKLLPWNLPAEILMGEAVWLPWGCLLAFTAAAYVFGRWQFERSLNFDVDAERAKQRKSSQEVSRFGERWFQLPSRLLPEPIAVIVEMELRFLSRSARFRLMLLMGCVLGQLLWLPQTIGRNAAAGSVIGSNYLTFCAMYALLVLGDNLFWNTFGFDRSGAQLFFVTPVKFQHVVYAKNLIAMIFITLQMCFVTLVCLLFRIPLPAAKIAEAFAVVYTFSLFLMALGNLGSLHQARPMNPAQAWRNSTSARMQASLMLVYPLLLMPIFLAYGARYAFESEAAFYGVLLIDALIAAGTYYVTMESVLEAVDGKKEQMLTALGQGDGPMMSS